MSCVREVESSAGDREVTSRMPETNWTLYCSKYVNCHKTFTHVFFKCVKNFTLSEAESTYLKNYCMYTSVCHMYVCITYLYLVFIEAKRGHQSS